MNPPADSSFAALKQVDAGLLSVGYAEVGPADGPAVMARDAVAFITAMQSG